MDWRSRILIFGAQHSVMLSVIFAIFFLPPAIAALVLEADKDPFVKWIFGVVVRMALRFFSLVALECRIAPQLDYLFARLLFFSDSFGLVLFIVCQTYLFVQPDIRSIPLSSTVAILFVVTGYTPMLLSLSTVIWRPPNYHNRVVWFDWEGRCGISFYFHPRPRRNTPLDPERWKRWLEGYHCTESPFLAGEGSSMNPERDTCSICLQHLSHKPAADDDDDEVHSDLGSPHDGEDEGKRHEEQERIAVVDLHTIGEGPTRVDVLTARPLSDGAASASSPVSLGSTPALSPPPSHTVHTSNVRTSAASSLPSPPPFPSSTPPSDAASSGSGLTLQAPTPLPQAIGAAPAAPSSSSSSSSSSSCTPLPSPPPLVVAFPCAARHVFHTTCLHIWLQTCHDRTGDDRSITCPFCRQPPQAALAARSAQVSMTPLAARIDPTQPPPPGGVDALAV